MLAMLGITTIAFSLFAFGIFGLVALNIRSALNEIEDRVEVRAFLVGGTSDAEVDTILQAATKTATGGERVVRYARFGVGFVRVLSFRSLTTSSAAQCFPGSIELRLRRDMRDPANIKLVSNKLSSYPAIEEVRYGREWVEKLYRIRNMAGVVGMGLGVVLALVATIIIGATIRMAILARAREIEIMRLVGATNWFVRFAIPD